MKILLLSLSIIATFFWSCTSSDVNKRIDKLSAKVDTLEKHPFGIDLNSENRTYKFEWFELGKEGHQIIDRLFYISI